MSKPFNGRRVGRLACTWFAMLFAAGVCGQVVITTPGGQVMVPAQEVITTPGGLEVIPPAPRGPLFGAIAYQRETGAIGLSYDYPTAGEAEASALARCGDSRCAVLLSLSQTCGALASGPRGAFTATGITREAAEQAARSGCGDPNCLIGGWTCTR